MSHSIVGYGPSTPIKKEPTLSSPIGYSQENLLLARRNTVAASPMIPPLRESQQVSTPLRDYRFMTAPKMHPTKSVSKSSRKIEDAREALEQYSAGQLNLSTSTFFL